MGVEKHPNAAECLRWETGGSVLMETFGGCADDTAGIRVNRPVAKLGGGAWRGSMSAQFLREIWLTPDHKEDDRVFRFTEIIPTRWRQFGSFCNFINPDPGSFISGDSVFIPPPTHTHGPRSQEKNQIFQINPQAKNPNPQLSTEARTGRGDLTSPVSLLFFISFPGRGLDTLHPVDGIIPHPPPPTHTHTGSTNNGGWGS